MPVNRHYPIAELLDAVRYYTAKTHRRVSFEYALMAGVNDTDKVADELAALLRGLLCHVNLIPLNPVAEAIGPDGALLTRPTQAHARRHSRRSWWRAASRRASATRAGRTSRRGAANCAPRPSAAQHDGGGMTRIAYFDMPAGISGDMTLAAFLHAGLSLEDLTYALGPLGLSGYTLRAEAASQHSLGGTRVVVDVAAGSAATRLAHDPRDDRRLRPDRPREGTRAAHLRRAGGGGSIGAWRRGR